MISGNAIYNFVVPGRLRTLRHYIFTVGAVRASCILRSPTSTVQQVVFHCRTCWIMLYLICRCKSGRCCLHCRWSAPSRQKCPERVTYCSPPDGLNVLQQDTQRRSSIMEVLNIVFSALNLLATVIIGVIQLTWTISRDVFWDTPRAKHYSHNKK